VVGVASGTDALVLALLALGVGPGDEVITVSHTTAATAAAIQMVGAIPVLVDVTQDIFSIDPNAIEAAITVRTKAVMGVHLYGHPFDVAAVQRVLAPYPIALIEDCAQAQDAKIAGRQVGSFGQAGCFSFYPTKNLGALGDGGVVCASTSEVVGRLRQLRQYGWSSAQFATLEGGRCSRLDELQAAILSIKLNYLQKNIERRRTIAARYSRALQNLPIRLPMERQGYYHTYHQYVICSDQREPLANYLGDAGILTGRHYPYPVHKQPAFANSVQISSPLTVTEHLSDIILSLPMFSTMTDDQVEFVIAAIRNYFAGK
jgi:dTDP-4-amino-4,6-dideoxygalactose transaminase